MADDNEPKEIDIEIRQLDVTEEPELYAQVLELRNEQLRKKIGLNLYDEDLSAEVNYVILVALTSIPPTPGAEPKVSVIGCVVLRPEDDGKTFRLKQMAVHPDFQGQYVGSRIIEKAEEATKAYSRSRIVLHARAVSKGFYTKLGYTVTSDEFIEINIPHYEMEKEL